MKPLALTLQAFGPFAHRQVIDFRALGERTFFLIHGPTGAGKTSILDGLCFALFGDSSGGEREARQMRSHHADAGTLTEVSLDFALGSERYRVKRVPEQMRKALRGGGETRQLQKAELWRLRGDGDAATEEPLASGWARVTERVVALLGFESRQFRQVIVLPQGRFFEFLKSSSQERERILQVLFGTELYKRIEEALKRAADELAGRGKEARTRRQALLDQAQAADEAQLAARAQAQRADTDAARVAETAARETALACEARLAAARQVDDRFRECDAAGQALEMLVAQQPRHDADRAVLQAARRAALLQPDEAAVREARAAADAAQALAAQRATEHATAQRVEQAAREEHARQAQRAPERDRLVARLAELEALRGRIGALEQARQAERLAQQRARQAAQRREAAQQAHAAADEALRVLQQDVQRLTATAAGESGARLSLQQLEQQQRQAVELAQVARALAQADRAVDASQAALRQAEAAALAAASARRATFERWLAGQAARIAQALVEGAPCPVCGGTDHPAPAHGQAAPVDDAALAAAEQAQQAAEAAQRSAAQQHADARQQQAVLRARSEALQAAGTEAPADVEARLQAARRALQQADEAARALQQKQAAFPAAQQALQQAQSALAQGQAEAQEAHGELQRALGQLAEREQAIPGALASAAALDAAVRAATAERDALQQALARAEAAALQAAGTLSRAGALAEEAAAAAARAGDVLREKEHAFEARLAEAGFAETQAWRAACRDAAAIDALEQGLAAFERALAAARERHQRALGQTQDLARPDLATLEAGHRAAQAALLAASNAVRDALAAQQVTEGFVASLAQIADAFAQLEQRHQMLRSLSDVATGGNTHRMSFQRYVLATLLEEVLAATTVRLRVMSRGRYEMRRRLEASDARAAGGLDLEVFDHYTGFARGVNTLSGGESFLASLALALGLSDVVQAHAGGIRLEAIFVDEGFGTLDPEALDFAIATLKGLQQAGRMVGIISHVGELKDWIDARLEVKATQDGSRAAFAL